MDDLSGIEGEWRAQDEPLPPVVTQLLEICGQTYLPFLAANAQAQMDGAEEVRLDILDYPFAQAPFAYQAKCYSKLRSQFEKLSPGRAPAARTGARSDRLSQVVSVGAD